jgi:hypothetical protein
MSTTSADPDDLVRYVEAAGDGTARLRTAAGDLRVALDHLRASEGTAAFLPDIPEADLDVTFLAVRWDRLAGWLDGVARAFAAADAGERGIRTLDDAEIGDRYAPPEIEVLRVDGRVVIDVGGGDDAVVIDDRGDVLFVTVNGASYVLEVDESTALVVRLGQGDDEVMPISPMIPGVGRTRAGLLIDGGRGDDEIEIHGGAAVLRGDSGDDVLSGSDGTDVILGGSGDDIVDGYGGDDRILGGTGEDLLYGETGDDAIDGGAGRDHVDGGAGSDRIAGSGGADVLSGGEGADVLDGGAGDDVAYTGPGIDTARGGAGADSLHVGPGDTIADRSGVDSVHRRPVDLTLLDAIGIDVEGPLADRIRSDLVTLASTDAGARLLEQLRGRYIRITESESDHHREGVIGYDTRNDDAGFGPAGGDRAPFSLSASPLVTIQHELVHAYDHFFDTQVPGLYLGPDADQAGRVRVDVDGDAQVVMGPDDEPRFDGDDRWVTVDADGDGVVTRSEIEAVGGPDLNGDGAVDSGDGWVPNRERDAVGLPVDHDQDPSTPDIPGAQAGGHPGWMNENGLRVELGVETRGGY